MNYFWRNNSIPVKISAIVMAGAMTYLFFVDGESFFGWAVFFVSLALTILLHTIDEQGKEVEMLRSPKPTPSSNEPPLATSTKKRLITLISTGGKTSEKVAQEALQNFQKYQRVETETESQRKASPSNEPTHNFSQKNLTKPPKNNEQPKL